MCAARAVEGEVWFLCEFFLFSAFILLELMEAVGSPWSDPKRPGAESGEVVGWTEEVVLGRRELVKQIALSASSQRRYQVGIRCRGLRNAPLSCSASLVLVDKATAVHAGMRHETPVIDRLQLQGKNLSVEQIFDVPEVSDDTSVHVEFALGPVSGLWRRKAEIHVQLLPLAPLHEDSGAGGDLQPVRKICHLRASSRHIDEHTDLPIANEYCGAEASQNGLADSSVLECSQSVSSPSIFPLYPASWDSPPNSSAAGTSPPARKPWLLANWAAQFRAMRPKMADKPDNSMILPKPSHAEEEARRMARMIMRDSTDAPAPRHCKESHARVNSGHRRVSHEASRVGDGIDESTKGVRVVRALGLALKDTNAISGRGHERNTDAREDEIQPAEEVKFTQGAARSGSPDEVTQVERRGQGRKECEGRKQKTARARESGAKKDTKRGPGDSTPAYVSPGSSLVKQTGDDSLEDSSIIDAVGSSTSATVAEDDGEICWRVHERVPASGLKGTFLLQDPGRYRLTLHTLAPTWIPNRAMGYVMTIMPSNKGAKAVSPAAPGAMATPAVAATRGARRLVFDSPEFLSVDHWFVLEASDVPAKVTYSLWSHAIFKTSGAHAAILRLSAGLAAAVPEEAWLVPSSSGGMRELEERQRKAPKRIDKELTEMLKAVDHEATTQMVLGVLALVCLSCFNDIAALTLVLLPLPPWRPMWQMPVSLRGVAGAAAICWCMQHPHHVYKQLLTWHQDWLNYNRVKKQAERVTELSERIKAKGLWGKLKLVRSEYMRTLHEHSTELDASPEAALLTETAHNDGDVTSPLSTPHKGDMSPPPISPDK